jgi:hypothetical protein
MSNDNALQNDELQSFIMQLYRLFKVGSLHLPNNESILRTCEHTIQQFRALEHLNANRLSILFLEDTVFLNGRLLKADRNTYECAVEIARYLKRIGFNELVIEKGAEAADIQRITSAFHTPWDRAHNAGRVKLRRIDPEVLATLMDSESDPVAKLGRTYAQAVVVMRYVYDALRERRVVAPRNLKRLMQQFCLLANEDLTSFTALARMRNPHDDDAGHAVKSAIVAMGVTRLITQDLRVLARIGLATLLYDTGRPRSTYIGLGIEAPHHAVLPLLQPHQIQRLPASSAVMVTAIARLHPDAIHRAISIYNGQLWDLARQLERPFDPDLESVVLSMSWKFVRAMAFDVRSQTALTPIQAYAWLVSTAETPGERIYCELLAHTLHLTPSERAAKAASPPAPVIRPTDVSFQTHGASTPSPSPSPSGSGRARYAPPTQRTTEVLRAARATGSFLPPESRGPSITAASPQVSPQRPPDANPTTEEARPSSAPSSLRPVPVRHADPKERTERVTALPPTGVRRPTQTSTAVPAVRPPAPVGSLDEGDARTRVVTGDQSARLLRNFVATTPAQQALGPHAPHRPTTDASATPSPSEFSVRELSGVRRTARREPTDGAPASLGPESGSTRLVTGEQSAQILARFVAAPASPKPPEQPTSTPVPTDEKEPGADTTRAVGAGDARALLDRFRSTRRGPQNADD